MGRDDGCWLYMGALFDSGYGAFKTPLGNRAHRVSWILHNGPIPASLLVLHHCDIRNCVNPEHLFLGTHADNHRDMDEKGRRVLRTGAHHRPESIEKIRNAKREQWRSLSPEKRRVFIQSSAKARLGKKRGRYKPCPARICEHCGATFEPTYPSSKVRFCSKSCSTKHRMAH